MTLVLSHKTSPAVKSRVIYFASDGICYETRAPLSESRARQMAGMFSANPRVRRAVAFRHHDRQYRVRIFPSSLSPLYKRVLFASQQKAASEGSSYNYFPMGYGAWECFNLFTGRRYRVRRDSCTCPHWTTRLNKLGAPCKHIEEARRRGLFEEEKD